MFGTYRYFTLTVPCMCLLTFCIVRLGTLCVCYTRSGVCQPISSCCPVRCIACSPHLHFFISYHICAGVLPLVEQSKQQQILLEVNKYIQKEVTEQCVTAKRKDRRKAEEKTRKENGKEGEHLDTPNSEVFSR